LSRLVSQSKATAPFQNMKITRLTSTGNVSEAAISPDGKYVSYATTAKGQQSIWLRHVQTSSDVQIVSPVKDSFFTDLIFSPDGNFVYYAQSELGKPINVLYRVPVLGGPPKKVKERIHGGLCFSPEGERIALTRWTPRGSQDTESKGGDKQLIVMNADGTEEQRLASRLIPLMLDNPAWSPDGRAIACTVTDSGDYSSSVIEIRLDNGSERVISSQKWFNAGHIAWLQDGSGLIFSASDSLSSPSQIWHISYPDGAARRITNDLNRYNNVSATTNSRTLVTAQADQLSNIWVVPEGDSTRAKQVTSGLGKYGAGSIITIAGFIKGDCGGGINWTPDGRIVYHSMASGRADIWIMDADGANQKQLTSEAGFNFYPSVSPDGRFIVFTSDRRGNPDLWRANIDGSNPIQLTIDGGQYPRCLPDGKWIIYFASGSGAVYPARIPIEGGARERFLTKNGHTARLDPSPDGRLVACNYISTQAADWYLLMAIIPADGGEPVKTFDIFTVDLVREIHWRPDGRALTYIDTRDGVSNIWSQPIDGGKPTQLTDFKSDLIFSWDWSRDGRLACARGTQTSDVVLINDFR
jgi:Tol biopolymer transport system component